MLKIICRYIICIIISLAANICVADSDEFHGFQIDSQRISEQQKSDILPSLGKQLDIVQSVGLPNAVVEFFKGIPILIDPGLTSMPGQYTNLNGQWLVRVSPVNFPENRPIVLHELLHAYHHQVLGSADQALDIAYQKAKQPGVYPESFQSAHFLENKKEYFAVIGTIYLFGNIQQPPFNCAIPSKLDPEYLAFLGEQFSPHLCH